MSLPDRKRSGRALAMVGRAAGFDLHIVSFEEQRPDEKDEPEVHR